MLRTAWGARHAGPARPRVVDAQHPATEVGDERAAESVSTPELLLAKHATSIHNEPQLRNGPRLTLRDGAGRRRTKRVGNRSGFRCSRRSSARAGRSVRAVGKESSHELIGGNGHTACSPHCGKEDKTDRVGFGGGVGVGWFRPPLSKQTLAIHHEGDAFAMSKLQRTPRAVGTCLAIGLYGPYFVQSSCVSGPTSGTTPRPSAVDIQIWGWCIDCGEGERPAPCRPR